MKPLSTLRNALGAFLVFITVQVSAQTNPAAQSLPYSQDFSGLLHSSTAYPAGLQGWKVSSAATTTIVTSGPTGDHALVANASASTTAGGVNNYNGKIGFLSSGSTNPGLALAINTTGLSHINLNYDIMVIRNPYDGAANTRINESVLQYRVGEAGAFTTLTGVEYQSTTVTQTGSGVTTPQNLQSMSIILPAGCDNQAIVQIRWINHDQTGAGSRPSFAVDNIIVVQDNDADTYVATNDCDDNNASVNPGATEICNGIDDNCAGGIDEGLTFTTYFTDSDGDGYGDNDDPGTSLCADPGAGYSTITGDCDDAHNTVYPGASEICDGLDNDCNGSTDEGTASATISPSGNVTICKGDFISMNANTGAGYSYQWFKNGNAVPGATNDNYTTNKTGYYEVQVTVPGGCFAISDATGVGGLANPNANISAPNGLNLCTGVVKLKASYNATYTYQWYLDGSPVGGATSYIYFPSATGDYYCNVSTAEGCARNTETLTVINVCREGEFYIGTLSVNPNPGSEFFNVQLTTNNHETEEVILQLHHLTGELVYERMLIVNDGLINQQIDVTDLSSGIYLLTIQCTGYKYDGRIVISK